MHWLAVLAAILGSVACATTSRVCPAGARLASAERATGRVEWCSTTTAGLARLPVPGRAYESALGMAHPSSMTGGLHGPFTHWHPSGAPESHGPYVEVDATSTADGVWGGW